MMFLPLLIGAAVAAAPAPARPETDAGKLAAAPAAAHRPYDFREEEEQNEFRRMKELLENDTRGVGSRTPRDPDPAARTRNRLHRRSPDLLRSQMPAGRTLREGVEERP